MIYVHTCLKTSTRCNLFYHTTDNWTSALNQSDYLNYVTKSVDDAVYWKVRSPK